MPHTRGHGSSPGGGDEPPDHPSFPGIVLRTQGVLTLAFGFALGFAFMIFFGLLRLLNPSFSLVKPTGDVANFIGTINPNLWLSFLFGFVVGTIMAAVYNLLVARRVNLFGLESSMDEITR